MPRASVVIRSKNEEELLGRTLEALERQSFQDFEVILVHFGHTHGPPILLRSASRFRNRDRCPLV